VSRQSNGGGESAFAQLSEITERTDREEATGGADLVGQLALLSRLLVETAVLVAVFHADRARVRCGSHQTQRKQQQRLVQQQPARGGLRWSGVFLVVQGGLARSAEACVCSCRRLRCCPCCSCSPALLPHPKGRRGARTASADRCRASTRKARLAVFTARMTQWSRLT
ncbi:unnamed protein product, partial [Laminaria digitata]